MRVAQACVVGMEVCRLEKMRVGMGILCRRCTAVANSWRQKFRFGRGEEEEVEVGTMRAAHVASDITPPPASLVTFGRCHGPPCTMHANTIVFVGGSDSSQNYTCCIQQAP